MSKSLGNYVGVDEPPEEVFGKLMRVPGRRDAGLLRPAARRAARPGAVRRATRSAPWRAAITERLHGAEAAATAEAHFDRLHVERGVPDDVEEHAFSSDNGTVHLPALLADAFGLSRSEGRRLLGPGRREARRRAARRRIPWTCRPPGSTAPCCRWAAGASSGSGSARARLEHWSRPPLQCYTAPSRSARSGITDRQGPRSLKTQQYARPKGRVQVRPPSSAPQAISDRATAWARGLNRPVESAHPPCVRGEHLVEAALGPAREDLTALRSDSGPEPSPGGNGLIPRQTFTESLILAQDERWRRA